MGWQACTTQGRMGSGTQMRRGSSFNNNQCAPSGAANRMQGVGTVVGRTGRCSRRWGVVVLYQQTPETPRKKGTSVKENTTKQWSAGPSAGEEGCNARRRCPRDRFVALASKSVAVTDCMPLGSGSLQRGYPKCPAWLRSDGMGTVRTSEAAGARAITPADGGRDCWTRGGVILRRADA